jgi:hypothetical protein
VLDDSIICADGSKNNDSEFLPTSTNTEIFFDFARSLLGKEGENSHSQLLSIISTLEKDMALVRDMLEKYPMSCGDTAPMLTERLERDFSKRLQERKRVCNSTHRKNHEMMMMKKKTNTGEEAEKMKKKKKKKKVLLRRKKKNHERT